MKFPFITTLASLVLSLISSALAQNGQVLDTPTVRFEWTDPANDGTDSDISSVTLYGNDGSVTSALDSVPHGAGFAEIALPADDTWTFWTQSTYVDGSEDATQSNILTNVVCNLEPPTGFTLTAVRIDARSTTYSARWENKGCANQWKTRIYATQSGTSKLLIETRKTRVGFPLPTGSYNITLTSVNRTGHESAHSSPLAVVVSGFDYASNTTAPQGLQNAATTSPRSFVLQWTLPANWNPNWKVVVWRQTNGQIFPVYASYRTNTRYHVTNLPQGSHSFFMTTRDNAGNESGPSSTVTFNVP